MPGCRGCIVAGGDVQESEDPHVTTGDDAAMRPGLPAAPRPPLSVSLDLDEITGQVLEAMVPGFADAGAVFVLEGLIVSGERGGGDGEVLVRRLDGRFAADRFQAPDTVFPAGEVVTFAPGTPFARCVASGSPVIFAAPDGNTTERVASRPGGREMLSRCCSFLAAAMTSRGGTTGLLVFARTAAAGPFGDEDAAAAASLAARAGDGIAGALLLRHQRTAEAMQRGLLTGAPVVPTGIEVAARCRPAAGQVIGGDWYDITALPQGRTGLVVGDVMGHGPEAAAVMAQLRAAASALAGLDLAPGEMLRRLDRTAATLRNAAFAVFATCVYAVIDPAAECVTIARAGHPPPVLALPGGATLVPDLPPGLPLGLGPVIFGQIRLRIPAGALLALYTDGLVETRSRTMDEGIQALHSALDGQQGSLTQVCDAVLQSLAHHGEDDTTLVLARIPPGGRTGSPPPVQL
jgi:hypothetical protein